MRGGVGRSYAGDMQQHWRECCCPCKLHMQHWILQDGRAPVLCTYALCELRGTTVIWPVTTLVWIAQRAWRRCRTRPLRRAGPTEQTPYPWATTRATPATMSPRLPCSVHVCLHYAIARGTWTLKASNKVSAARLLTLSHTDAACVAGLAQVSLGSCDGDTGDNQTVSQANYTCNAGYYKSPAPAFCTRMCQLRRDK
jgi:hypothetical protein